MSDRTPVEVAQAQLEAYNARDLDTFMTCFADDAQLFELGGAAPTTIGKAAIADRYRQLFARSPRLRSQVLNRSSLGRVVVDLERITGRNGSDQPFDIMAIYEIADGLIQRAHFARP